MIGEEDRAGGGDGRVWGGLGGRQVGMMGRGRAMVVWGMR